MYYILVVTELINWLLEGDPSIRWQVMQDLQNADFSNVFKMRRQMTKEGWAAQLLNLQDKETGMWGNGLYNPKWISTHYSMLFLKRIGLLPNKQTTIGSTLLFNKGLKSDGGINFSKNDKSETCITGMVLGICSYNALQDNRMENVIDYLLDAQKDDGGWNCRTDDKHSSFNTTLLVLEGLLAFRETYSDNNRLSDIRNMQKVAHEFLLEHHLFQSHRTGEIAHREFIKLVFPPRWRYNLLSALDYFQTVNFRFDDRFIDALELLNKKKLKNGKWWAQRTFNSGKEYFSVSEPRIPSRWVTLKALKINKWWESKSRG